MVERHCDFFIETKTMIIPCQLYSCWRRIEHSDASVCFSVSLCCKGKMAAAVDSKLGSSISHGGTLAFTDTSAFALALWQSGVCLFKPAIQPTLVVC